MVYGRRADGEPMPATIVVDRQTFRSTPGGDRAPGISARPAGDPDRDQTFPADRAGKARATFVAAKRRIDVAHQAPVSGSLDGVSPMGHSVDGRLPAKLCRYPPIRWMPASGPVSKQQARRASRPPPNWNGGSRRRGSSTTHSNRRSRRDAVSAAGGGRFPRDRCQRRRRCDRGIQAAVLASHGYAALALAYFRAAGPAARLVNIPLEYFEGAIAWVARAALVQRPPSGGMGTRAAANLRCCWGRLSGDRPVMAGRERRDLSGRSARRAGDTRLVPHGPFAAIRCLSSGEQHDQRSGATVEPAVRWPTRRSTGSQLRDAAASSVRPFRSRSIRGPVQPSPAGRPDVAVIRSGRYRFRRLERTVIRLPSVT